MLLIGCCVTVGVYKRSQWTNGKARRRRLTPEWRKPAAQLSRRAKDQNFYSELVEQAGGRETARAKLFLNVLYKSELVSATQTLVYKGALRYPGFDEALFILQKNVNWRADKDEPGHFSTTGEDTSYFVVAGFKNLVLPTVNLSHCVIGPHMLWVTLLDQAVLYFC